MAEPDLILLLQAMNVLANRLADAAAGSDWDEVLAQLPTWQTLQNGLRDIDWQTLNASQRQSFEDALRALQLPIDRLIGYAQTWRPELAALLQGNNNASKLQQTYR